MATTGTTKATTACRTSRFMPSTLHPTRGHTLGHLDSQLSQLCNFEHIVFLLPYHVASIHRSQEQGRTFSSVSCFRRTKYPYLSVRARPIDLTWSRCLQTRVWSRTGLWSVAWQQLSAKNWSNLEAIAQPRIEFQLTALIPRWRNN